MDYAIVISSIVLGLSVLATIAKFIDWFMHSDPKTMVRTTRWMLLLLVAACIPVLVFAIVHENWSVAMLLGAVVLIVPTFFLKWRAALAPLRAAFDQFRRRPRPFDMEVWEDAPDDPATVRRAAAILEAYLNKSSLVALSDARRDEAGDGATRVMARREALDVLGLAADADEAAIRAAHKRLMELVHPDRNGSVWLASKVQQARDTLLAPASQEWLRSQARTAGSRNRSANR
jgi:hypothetical protein